MALNKYMHPHNIYKNPPDFAKLAKLYKEFGKVVKTDVTGKVKIDFKDPHSLRILTKCLLKSDFNLDVHIPEDRLVPTLPLRLNYILWLEDLLKSIHRTESIRGLDIGTGACAIYPLLAATKNKWHMVATETDDESLKRAQENVNINNLKGMIELRKNTSKLIFEYLFADEDAPTTFDFNMCNPPFYSTVQELCDSRSPARLPPKNGFTGSPQELITEGGELSFCRKMINESKQYKHRILIFTTMVGHKFNLKQLEEDLQADSITYTSTEFCQGWVTRWGLAWTYQDYDLAKLVPSRDKSRKKNVPIEYILPELSDVSYDFETITKKIILMLEQLKIEYKILNKRGNSVSLHIQAKTNTWSNQRRKRRLMQRIRADDSKKQKTEEMDKINAEQQLSQNTADKIFAKSETKETKSIDDFNFQRTTKQEHNLTNAESNTTVEIETINNNRAEINSVLDTSSNNDITSEPLIHALFKILKKDKNIIIEMEFLNGIAGKEGLHQIVQYIKNHWK